MASVPKLAALITAAAVSAVALAGPDGVTDAGPVAIYARCEDFAPDAGDVAVQLDGGAVVLSLQRARYDACLVGAGRKCSELLAAVDAGTAQPQDHSTLHLVTAIVSSAAAVFTAYSANRSARHLGLLP